MSAQQTIAGLVLLLSLILNGCGGGLTADPAAANSGAGTAKAISIQEGHARFTVLTPTLLRLEYADDDRFEDGLTQTVVNRSFPATDYITSVENGVRIIKTRALTLRYKTGTGAFTDQNLSISLKVGTQTGEAKPLWTPDSNPGNLGGWRRSLDNDQDPQTFHNGLLSREGWYLLNDSQTVLMTSVADGYKPRPTRSGAYQDGYFFGYGHDYPQGLADLRALTGPAPLLPRKAFGVWFSRYWAYSETEFKDLIAQFRIHQVPIDTLSLDTDWKNQHSALGCVFFSAVAGARIGDPCSWNGWGWNTTLFPDPQGFVNWAHSQGLNLALNIHPSINSNDQHFAATQNAAGGLQTDTAMPPCTLFQADPTGNCYVFDWTKPAHLKAYFDLHKPMEALGIDFWWLDWCCDGSSAKDTGLTPDTWINAHYAANNRARGQRWPAFSRIGASFQEGQAGIGNNGAGAFAEHRYTLHFTGDTCGTWQMLAHEAEFTIKEGAIGLPYVSHDIGSFLGPPTQTGCNGTLGHTSHLPDDLYVRWVQFGTFQPLDRLHSHHGDRLPWDYPGAAEQAATAFLRLRERLVPHLYTLARTAYDKGLPMTRALYYQWPELDDAYQHPTHYLLGDDLLIAPVTTAGNPASTSVWIPPGTWVDYFTGERLTGPGTVTRSVPFERYPVFARSGSILVTQPDLMTSSAGPQDNLIVSVWPATGATSSYELYEDEGIGFAYEKNAYSQTRLQAANHAAGCNSVIIGAQQGSFPGALPARSWEIRLIGTESPSQVLINGANISSSASRPGWSYDSDSRTLIIKTGALSTASTTRIDAQTGGCP